MTDETIERIFVTPVPARLSLSNICGSVEIMPCSVAGSQAGRETSDEGTIEVTAIKRLNTGNAERTKVQMEQAEDGKVTVKTTFDGGFSWWLFQRPCAVDYIVRLPHRCSVEVSGVSNTCSVEGLEGEITLETVSGPLTLRDLSGQLKMNTVSGKISGERLSGPLKYDTVSGKVHLTGSDLPTVKGHTVSGGVVLETPLGEGPYHFDSVSGDLRLILPEVTACTINMSSVSGQIKTSLPVTSKWRDGHTHPGGDRHVEVKGGGRQVHFNSVSGSLWLESLNEKGRDVLQAEVQAEGQTEMRAEKPLSLSHEEILDKIDRGEMTVEQALHQLK